MNLVEDSNRTRDEEFGYLTVENCVLTGNDVAQYFGREIPDFKKLGLEPEKIYNVYRPENEIKNSDFSNKPLLSQHADFSAEDYKHKLVVGTVGETFMRGQQKLGTVVFWDKKAIEELEKGKKYLSCGYLYTPKLERGFHNNTRYDVKMIDIIANHVAMVDNPRYKAALVADENLTKNSKKGFLNMFFNKKKEEEKIYTFDRAIEDVKKILVSDEEEDLKEKAMSEVKKKLKSTAKDNKMSKDKKMGKDKKDEKMCEDDEDMEEGEWGEGAEDAELEDKEQKEEEDEEAREDKKMKTKDKKMSKDKKMAKDENYISKLVADSVAIEIEKHHKKTIALDSAIKEYERTCGRVNKLAFDSAEKVLNTILKNHGKSFENKSFEQKEAMVEMLPNAGYKSSQTLVVDNSSVSNHTPENILKFLKRG